MPELPEVEFARSLMDTHLTGKRLRASWCDADSIVFAEDVPDEVARSLTGQTLLSTHRRGKYFWLRFSHGWDLVVHLGMTGQVLAQGEAPLELMTHAGAAKGKRWPPRFAKMILEAEDGTTVAITNARRFGRLFLRSKADSEAPIDGLGFDPVQDMPDPTRFFSLLKGRRGTIKGLLLNQKFIAGVGNWIADEVLYQSRIAPQRTADSLSPKESNKLRSSIVHVVGHAVKVGADKARFPKTWLFHVRWGKQAGAVTARGEEIAFDTVAGRTTAWVPAIQV